MINKIANYIIIRIIIFIFCINVFGILFRKNNIDKINIKKTIIKKIKLY